MKIASSWKEIYEVNKKLDDVFIEKYHSTIDYDKKNIVEFLVELGEFANETKCFKYWTVKKAQKEKVLEEFADCITMSLLYFHLLNLELEELDNPIETENVLDVLMMLYEQVLTLNRKLEEDTVRSIFSNLLYLGTFFQFTEEEIQEAIRKKQKITWERLNSDY